MNDERQQEKLIAKLYAEASPEELRELDAAIESDPEVRQAWEELCSTRRLLQEHRPEVPTGKPSVVVLQPRRRAVTPWGFASGFAAAAAMLLVGVLLGGGVDDLRGIATPTRAADADGLIPVGDLRFDPLEIMEAQHRLSQRQDAVEQQLAGIDASGRPAPGSPTGADATRNASWPLSKQRYENDLAKLTHQVSFERERDLAYVLEEMQRLEALTRARMADHESMLRYLLAKEQAPAGAATN